MSSWTELYKLKTNDNGTIDIILPKPKRREQKTLRIYEYQLEFLREHYDDTSFSNTMIKAIDDLIKYKNNINSIILVTEEVK